MNEDRTVLVVLILMALAALATFFGAAGLRLFARAIAFAEGYGVPGAIPTVRNNPGDLKVSGDGSITTFASVADGWDALYRQLALIVSGRSRVYNLNMSIAEMASKWTATEQSAWTNNVVTFLRQSGLDVSSQTRLREVLI